MKATQVNVSSNNESVMANVLKELLRIDIHKDILNKKDMSQRLRGGVIAHVIRTKASKGELHLPNTTGGLAMKRALERAGLDMVINIRDGGRSHIDGRPL